MKHLYYVRHGLSEMNMQGVWSGQVETPLTQKGREQATLAGKELQEAGIHIDYIIASPLSRAHDTAKLIAKEIGYPIQKIETNPLFIERHFGALEGQPWQPDLDIDGISDIESTDTIINRARLALDYLESLPYDNILVSAHGSIGRAIRHHIIAVLPYHQYELKLPNATVIQWL